MSNPKERPSDPSPQSEEIQRLVTLTLPEKTLRILETVDKDLTKAIVKLTNIAIRKAFPQGSAFEVVKVASRKSVLIVGSDTQLARIPWLKLVEIAPGRNLITIPSGTSLESLEVEILALIEKMGSEEETERTLLTEFSKYVGRLRRYKRMSRAEIMIVDTDV